MSARKLMRCLRTLVFLIRRGEGPALVREMRRRIYSTDASWCLRRDLSVPFEAPAARVPLSLRTLSERDLPAIARELPRRLPFIRAGVPTCYVATDADDQVMYMQWLLGPESNETIRDHFGERLPQLADDEMLLEHAFTLPAYRGQRVMPSAMAQIAERAAERGARWVLTFVRVDNVPSLKGCERAGFEPHMLQTITWRLFRQRIDYQPAPARRPAPQPLGHEPALVEGSG